MLKILIAGSQPKMEEPSNDHKIIEENFIKMCEEIGRQLADRKHQIYLLSDYERHADIYVFRGYGEVATKKNIKVPPLRISYGFENDPENEDYDKFEQIKRQYRNVITKDLYTDDKYPFNRVAIIEEIDALIIIGGSTNSAHLVEIAKALKKTIIPLKSFGGTASLVWDKTNSMLNLALKGKIDPIIGDAGDFSSNRVKGFIDIVERMVKIQKNETTISYKVLILVEILVLILWFAIFITGKIYPLIALPALIFLMSFCGIIFRSLVRLHNDSDQDIPIRFFLIEIGIGLALGVVYYIFFLLGASSISSNFEESLKQNAFNSIACVVSLLSIAVSFVLQESIENIHKRFSSIAEIKQ